VPAADALPDYHHRERHSIRVAASPARALAAARETELNDVPLVRALVRLRGLGAARPGPVWEALRAEGFRQLGDDTLVLVGKPWLRGGERLAVDDFAAFAEPGWAKMALDLRAEPDDGGARLTTETRVLLTDRGSRRRFAAYWLVVRPFSGLIRRRWLRAARRRAET
jgi:hypothetical protein